MKRPDATVVAMSTVTPGLTSPGISTPWLMFRFRKDPIVVLKDGFRGANSPRSGPAPWRRSAEEQGTGPDQPCEPKHSAG
jgi:hypothetical protein